MIRSVNNWISPYISKDAEQKNRRDIWVGTFNFEEYKDDLSLIKPALSDFAFRLSVVERLYQRRLSDEVIGGNLIKKNKSSWYWNAVHAPAEISSITTIPFEVEGTKDNSVIFIRDIISRKHKEEDIYPYAVDVFFDINHQRFTNERYSTNDLCIVPRIISYTDDVTEGSFLYHIVTFDLMSPAALEKYNGITK